MLEELEKKFGLTESQWGMFTANVTQLESRVRMVYTIAVTG